MKKIIFIITTVLTTYCYAFGQKPVRVNPIIVDTSFDSISLSKLRIAVHVLDSIYNSEAFAEEVLHTDFNIGNLGLSNVKIYNLIMSGADNYENSLPDFSIDLRVRIFDEYFGSGNFGLTDMNDSPKITSTHRCYILKNDVKCYISHLAHEYMHQIGFYDEKTWFGGTKTKSVPYKIGNIVDKLIGNQCFCTAIEDTCKKN